MPVTHIRIENYKSIKRCDIDLNNTTALIGANGTGKTNILEAIHYFYSNLTEKNTSEAIFDANNRFSNEVKITLTFDLSNFVIISKTKTNDFDYLFEDTAKKSRYSKYFQSIMSLVSSKKEKTISVQMSQIKGMGIHWSESFQKRTIIKSLFPFFYIDVRNLDLNEWSEVWEVLGELSKVSNAERKTLENQVCELVENDVETANKVKAIRKVFDSSEVSVVPKTSKEFAAALSKLYFSGEQIQQKGRGLQYFSTGTNSVKYIELLLRAINEIARNKMKEPVVLIDEPEISLHPNFIDELADVIMILDSKLKPIVSTHSSRLIKRMLSFESVTLYNVKLENHHTVTNLMKRFQQYSPSSKYRVLDDHINSYFSKGILFVEGETELELFSNPYLHILFPFLKTIDVFQAMSQEPILNIMNPRKTKSNVPYICLIDADKTFKYNTANRCFELKNEYFKNPKERFYFRNKKSKSDYLYHLHLRIIGMAEKLKVHYYEPYFSCNDVNLENFIKAIHKYLLSYGVFMFRTTIEGALVNEHNLSFSLEFLKRTTKSHDFEEFLTLLNSYMKADKFNIMRLVYNGKTDLLKNYKGNDGVKKRLDEKDALIIEKVMVGKKTSGWVSEYIDFFFSKMIPEDIDKSPRGMKQYFENNSETQTAFVKEFEFNFPELYELFTKICAIIS
mgnify:FL=1